MIFESIQEMNKRLIESFVREGDVVLDATVGNGHDTMFLAERVGATGKVIGFDIQVEAIEKTRTRLQLAGLLDRVHLIHAGHETLIDWMPRVAEGTCLAAAVFNLGYRPGGDHSRITTTETTLEALNQTYEFLKSGGLLAVTVYPGHPGGREEADAVVNWARDLDPVLGLSLWYQFLNRNDPPSLVAIRKA